MSTLQSPVCSDQVRVRVDASPRQPLTRTFSLLAWTCIYDLIFSIFEVNRLENLTKQRLQTLKLNLLESDHHGVAVHGGAPVRSFDVVENEQRFLGNFFVEALALHRPFIADVVARPTFAPRRFSIDVPDVGADADLIRRSLSDEVINTGCAQGQPRIFKNQQTRSDEGAGCWGPWACLQERARLQLDLGRLRRRRHGAGIWGLDEPSFGQAYDQVCVRDATTHEVIKEAFFRNNFFIVFRAAGAGVQDHGSNEQPRHQQEPSTMGEHDAQVARPDPDDDDAGPMLHLVLDRPAIAGNVGACVRLCAATGAALHVCGSQLDPGDRAMWRAGLDYWPRARVHFHDSLKRCLTLLQQDPWIVEVGSTQAPWDVDLVRGSIVVLGPEKGSVNDEVQAAHRQRILTLPQRPGIRSLNLAQCAAVVVFEALRQQTRGRA